MMHKKFLSVGSLALLQIVIVGNLQSLPANAIYGASLPILYLFAVIGFFLPCVLMTAELATSRPQTGGGYIWCEQAFGPKVGFFTVTILWISNLLWYPSIFSLISANLAYLFNPALALNKFFVIGVGLVFFWLFTAINCTGIKFASRTSVVCSVIGIILPMILISIGGIYWYFAGQPMQISFSKANMIPQLTMDNIGFLIAIVISLFGIELTGVHAGDVKNPKRDYPLSLLISSSALLLLVIGSELSIAAIIPAQQLSVLTGLLDALTSLTQRLNLYYLLGLILFLVLLGNIGSVSAWMLASTRGMYVALKKNNIAKWLQQVNKQEAPVGVLIFEAIIFTLVSGVFLIFPNVIDSFWLLLVLASQITLIYYIILFAAAMRLRELPRQKNGFVIPGGKVGLWIIMGLGMITSLVALCVGFIPPGTLDKQNRLMFELFIVCGLVFTILVPFLFLFFKKFRFYIRK